MQFTSVCVCGGGYHLIIECQHHNFYSIQYRKLTVKSQNIIIMWISPHMGVQRNHYFLMLYNGRNFSDHAQVLDPIIQCAHRYLVYRCTMKVKTPSCMYQELKVLACTKEPPCMYRYVVQPLISCHWLPTQRLCNELI